MCNVVGCVSDRSRSRTTLCLEMIRSEQQAAAGVGRSGQRVNLTSLQILDVVSPGAVLFHQASHHRRSWILQPGTPSSFPIPYRLNTLEPPILFQLAAAGRFNPTRLYRIEFVVEVEPIESHLE